MKIKNFYILFLILVSQNLKAQNVRLFINKEDASVKIKQKQLFKNEKEAQQYLKTTQQKLILQGYLEASFDSIKQQHDSIFADLHTGRKYTVNNPVVDVNKRKKKKPTPSGSVFEADVTKETLIQNLENNDIHNLHFQNLKLICHEHCQQLKPFS